MALLTFLVDVKNAIDNSNICKSDDGLVLAYFLKDGAKGVYEAYTANETSTNTQDCRETWPMLINPRASRFFSKNML